MSRLLRAEPENVIGESVSVRGYLRPVSGRLVLFQNQKFAEKGNQEGGVDVVDTSNRKTLRHEGLYYQQTCTFQTVDLVGEIGLDQATGRYSIIRIREIHIVDSANRRQAMCFDFEDAGIYQPAEIAEGIGE